MALMGTLWAATMLGVWAAGAWTHATAAFGILAGAVLVFAVGECLHGAIHTPLSVDLAPPQLVGRYTAAASISWQIGWIIGPAAGGFLLQHRPLLLWPIAAAVNLACAAAALALEPQLPAGVRGRRTANRFRCQFRRAGSISRPCPRPQTPSVPVPSLPRIRSRRAAPGRPVAAPRPGPAELSASGVTWVHLLGPTTEEAQQLATRFGWHPLDVEDVLSRRQRPKVDVYAGDDAGRDGYLFTVLHFPVYDAAIGRLNAGELDAFIGRDYIVTLPAVELRPVSLLFRRAAESEDFREQLLSRGSGRLLYEVLDDLYDYCFPILDKIGFKLEQIDEELLVAGDGAKELVRDIHRVKQEIISYRKIVKPQRPTLRQLERQIDRFLPEGLELYFDDLVDA